MSKGDFLLGLGLGLLILAGVVLWEPKYNPDRCRTNCIGATIAWDLTQRGMPATARSFEPVLFDEVIRTAVYPTARELTTGDSLSRLQRGLYQQGGERGYLRYARRDGSRHMVAYVRLGGLVYIVDAQTCAMPVPLCLFWIYDRGLGYSFARLDNIDYADCDLLDKVVERWGK